MPINIHLYIQNNKFVKKKKKKRIYLIVSFIQHYSPETLAPYKIINIY